VLNALHDDELSEKTQMIRALVRDLARAGND